MLCLAKQGKKQNKNNKKRIPAKALFQFDMSHPTDVSKLSGV